MKNGALGVRTSTKTFRAITLATTAFLSSGCSMMHLGQSVVTGEGQITLNDGKPAVSLEVGLQVDYQTVQPTSDSTDKSNDNHDARKAMFQELSALQGLKTVNGPDHAAVIQEMHASVGLLQEADETAWCSSAVNWAAERAGLKGTQSAAARSWLKWSASRPISLEDALPGDVIIFWRESLDSWKGHVGLYVGSGADADTILVLGGNQGNALGIDPFPIDRVLGVRRALNS